MADLLTPETAYNATPPERGSRIIWDASPKEGGVSGFGLRITAAGTKSFILGYRFSDASDRRKSSQYRFTIGQAKASPRGSGWSVGEARRESDRWRKLIDRGETHPLAERKGRREAVKAAREAPTFKEAVEDYIQHEQIGRKGNATAGEVRRALLTSCAAWLDLPVTTIGAGDIGKLLRLVRDGDAKTSRKPTPYMANRLHSYLAAFFRWASRPDVALVTITPMLAMPQPWDGEESRSRVYSDDELARIWRAADDIGGAGGAFVKLAILSGKRKGALSKMRWSEIREDGGSWTWTPPADPRRRKRNKLVFVAPLAPLAQRVLKALRPAASAKDDSSFVFRGRLRGSHLYPGSDLAGDVKERSGVADFGFHACRHTCETKLAELRVPPHVRDLLLDHVPARGSGGGYDHHNYGCEQREAAELWARHVESLIVPAAGITMLR